MCHALMNNRAKKEGETGRAINKREKGNVDESRGNDAPGTIFASRIAGNGSTVPRRKGGRRRSETD